MPLTAKRGYQTNEAEDTHVAYALRKDPGGTGQGHNTNYVAHALTSEGSDASEDGTGRGTPLVAAPLSHGSNPNSNMAGRRREDDENLVTAFSHTQGIDAQPSSSSWPTLRSEGGGQAVGLNTGVRRLTPRECERLQALPDDWTAHGPDSRRYAALGDAVTASVGEWIGRRMLLAHLKATVAA